jgi:hypothetical protein
MKRILAVVGLLFCSTTLLGAYASFVKFNGLKGPSTDPAHQGWFAVSSLSWGVHGGNMPGDPHDVTLTLPNSPGLSQLTMMSAQGHAQTITVDVAQERYTFDSALISGVSFNSHSNDVTLKLNFGHFTMTTTAPAKTTPAPPQAAAATMVNPIVNPFAPNAQLFINDTPGERLRLVGLRFTGEHTAVLTVREGAAGGFFQRSPNNKNPKLAVQKDSVKFIFSDCLISTYSRAADGTATVGLKFAQYYGPAGGMP